MREFLQDFLYFSFAASCRMQFEFRIKFFRYEPDRMKKWRDNSKLDIFRDFKRKHGDKFALVGKSSNEHLESNKIPIEELKKWAKKYEESKGSSLPVTRTR